MSYHESDLCKQELWNMKPFAKSTTATPVYIIMNVPNSDTMEQNTMLRDLCCFQEILKSQVYMASYCQFIYTHLSKSVGREGQITH